jgi:maleylacetoacetate isomerase
MHPLNNLRVLNYLRDSLHCEEDTVNEWYRHWIAEGFRPLEAMIRDSSGAGFCVGESPTLADVCLAPQVFNARRFECDMSAYPNIVRVYEHLITLPAFQRAAPENQPDAV